MGKDSCRIAGLQCREVINICDGERLGYVGDVEIAVESGRVVALVIQQPWNFKCLFRPPEELVVLWEDVERVGEEIILVRRVQPPRPRPRKFFF